MKRALLIATLILVAANASEIENYLKELAIEAKKEDPNFKAFSAERGKKIFFTYGIGKRGKKIACTSCHTEDLTKPGKNIFTGKEIEPLSPKVNKKRLKNLKDVKKWLKRNFKDVYNKEGSPKEKGDVLTYILNQ